LQSTPESGGLPRREGGRRARSGNAGDAGAAPALKYAGWMTNRSVPADTVLPHIVYADVAEAIEWLTATFGFEEHYRYGAPDGPPSGAQMLLGKAVIMLNAARPDSATPHQIGRWTQSLTVFVDDVDAHFAHSKAAGANIVEELHETCYGERQYGVIDLAGHHWLFSRHATDLSPNAWGARLAPAYADSRPGE